MRSLRWIAGVTAMLMSVSGLVAGGEEFAKANQAYSDGRFEEAVAGYETLVREGAWNANLFYNLGNAWYRLGNFGKAILNYERSLALEPHHPEAEANVRLARDEARALELRGSDIERYVSAVTARQLTIAATITFWLALFLGVHWYFAARRSRVSLGFIALSLCITAAAILGIVTLENGKRGDSLAVITGKETEARLATADNAKGILVLPPGSQVKVLSQRGEWVYAELPNAQRGWIPATVVERVRM
jgi:tetratricopeptide (TPR) repeat protein